MNDRSIPFYNVIMKCSSYVDKPISLPEGYTFSPYKMGFGKYWAEMEYAVGDFPSVVDAEKYFCESLLPELVLNPEKGVFILNKEGIPVGSCLSWFHPKGEGEAASLHWAIVSPLEQGKGLGRAACSMALKLHADKGELPVYLHTQPWSWTAMLLYISLGFKVQKTDSFSKYENQYSQAMETLKSVMPEDLYRVLEINSED